MNAAADPCPMCEHTNPVSLAVRGKYELVRCTKCGQHYCSPAPTVEEIIGFYQGDYHSELRTVGGTEKIFGPKFANYRDWVLTFLQGGRSIDLGTATGLFPAMLKAAGFDAEGTDYDKKSVAWGSEHYGINLRVGGLDQIANQMETYDLISMTDVLEHTEHPLHALEAARRSLKPNGYMLITFPDIRSVESLYQQSLSKLTGKDWVWPCCRVPLHVWEFTPKTAHAMFDRAGFDVVGFRRTHIAEDLPGIAGFLTAPLNLIKLSPFDRMFGSQMEFMIRRRG